MPKLKRKSDVYRQMANKRWRGDPNEHDEPSLDVPMDVPTETWSQRMSSVSAPPVNKSSREHNGGTYTLVNFDCLNLLLNDLKCPGCNGSSLKFKVCRQIGFASEIQLACLTCQYAKKGVSSKLEDKSYDVNVRMTQAFDHIGKGYSGIEQFCLVMDMPVYSSKTHRRCEMVLREAYKNSKTELLSEVRETVKKSYVEAELAPSTTSTIEMAVSFDGTWLTRGHTSLLGVSCVIDILTGYAVDYHIMSKVCRLCTTAFKDLGDSAEFHVWYEGHKKECCINHEGSSNSMEMAAAEAIWKRSEALGFQYKTMLSDGDSKAFNHLQKLSVYGDKVTLIKEECVNHVSKRLGTGLREVIKKAKAKGITLGGKKAGSLKDATIKKLTQYYQSAILKHKGNPDSMKTAIYATLYHAISTDAKPQHSKCPTGVDSWCFFQAAVAENRRPVSHAEGVKTPINEAFLPYILPVYQRLASNELLERCARCATQNANESLHSVIWSKCPKEKFVHRNRLEAVVSEAINEFNVGVLKTLQSQQTHLKIPFGSVSRTLGTILIQRKKKKQMRKKSLKQLRARKILSAAKKRREKSYRKTEGVTYKAGNF